MKKFILFSSILLLTNLLYSQSWTTSQRTSSSSDVNEISSTIDDQGSVYSLGHFVDDLTTSSGESAVSYGGRDYYLIKYMPDGSIDWINIIGSAFSDFIYGGIAVDSNRDVYITGAFLDYVKYTPTDSLQSSGSYDIFLIKYDNSGNVVWARNSGLGTNMQFPTTMSIDNDNNLLVSGNFIDSINIYSDTTLFAPNMFMNCYSAKFNPSSGDLVWAKHFIPIASSQGINVFDIGVNDLSYTFLATYKDSILIEEDTITAMNFSQDVCVINTDLNGNVNWTRRISGDISEFSYSSTIDDEGNFYIAGLSNSNEIFIDSTDSEAIVVPSGFGELDIYVAKYNQNSTLEWARAIGGKGEEKVYDIEFYDDEIHISGQFVDTLQWGGIELATTGGLSDVDMLIGTLDKDGNFRSAQQFGGRNNSTEQAWATFKNGDNLISVIRSNSDLLILGDSTYTSTNGNFYIVMGVVGCLPISVDNTIPTNITGCFGDATGSIQVVASGGFGTPWQYSIDNGLSYSSVAFYQNLPAGDYQVVVIDKENCTQVGPLITLTEPDTLEVQVVSTEDITKDHDGSIVVVAQGGTSPYTYWLQPDGAPQAYGTFVFVTGDSGVYVVAVDDLNNCGPSLTDSLVINEILDTTGIGTSSGLLVKVYPNPTSGIITIEMPFEGAECDMEVLSMTGQLILKRRVYSSGGVITETLDLSDQAKGLYMLRIDGQALRSAIMVK